MEFVSTGKSWHKIDYYKPFLNTPFISLPTPVAISFKVIEMIMNLDWYSKVFYPWNGCNTPN